MWTTEKVLKQQLQKQWDKGIFLSALVTKSPLFPLKLKLVKPNSQDITDQFEQVRKWVSQIKQIEFISIKWKTIQHRIQGEQQLPDSIWVNQLDDILRLLNKNKVYQQFNQIIQHTAKKEPLLLDWLAKYPFKALTLTSDWEKLLQIIIWKKSHPTPNIYLRQIDLPNIHTKFIEQHKSILMELFEITLPPAQIQTKQVGLAKFEARYGFLHKPKHLRLRNLDYKYPIIANIVQSDLALDSQSFAQLTPYIENVIIVENEINFLTLPKIEKTWAIFGAGYGFSELAHADWLHRCRLYYWGDIDTHGFAILNQLRCYFPDTISLLMDEQTLLSHFAQCSLEPTPYRGELNHLSPEELTLFTQLKTNQFGENLRLEQERIPYSYVIRELQLNFKLIIT